MNLSKLSSNLNCEIKPIISVLTPSWNRAKYLERVWNGLNSQTFRNFEWIVSDDGSEDDTRKVIESLAAQSNFPVILITASEHIGKARMDNEALALASGDFILWNDSDDYYLPEAFKTLVSAWEGIHENEIHEYVGLLALCLDQNGNGILNRPLPYDDGFTSTWNELKEDFGITGDWVMFYRASALKPLRFPEVDFVIPESCVWTLIGDSKMKVIPSVLKIVEYNSTVHSITNTGKMSYNRGCAVSMSITERKLKERPRSSVVRIRKLINFIRYSIHGDISLKEQIQIWGNNTELWWFLFALPVASLLSIRDRLKGKVVKTHIDFLRAKNSVVVKNFRLN